MTHPAVPNRTGILLVQLGTPEAATPSAIRKFLRPFLSDKRVITLPRLLWLPILYLFILPFRPYAIRDSYASIWENDSPLREATQALTKALQGRFEKEKTIVSMAMRYGSPSIKEALEELKAQGARKLIVLPLFPQYSSSTVGSVFDEVSHALHQWQWIPELHFISGYSEQPGYIALMAEQVRRYWTEHEQAEKLLICFHGLPKDRLQKGDPYYCFCHKTARQMAEELNLHEDQWMMVFQSRFGKAQWCEPYCDQTLESLADKGILNVDIICPSFAADCLETLHEIGIEYAQAFEKRGGKLHLIPAPNACDSHVNFIHTLCG